MPHILVDDSTQNVYQNFMFSMLSHLLHAGSTAPLLAGDGLLPAMTALQATAQPAVA